MNENFLTALVVILVLILICRELTCWYLKQNEIVGLLKSIDSSLKNPAGIENNPSPQNLIKCGGCGKENIKGLTHCVSCGGTLNQFIFK